MKYSKAFIEFMKENNMEILEEDGTVAKENETKKVKRDKSFLNALAKAKRNIMKYSAVENILDVVFGYNLRENEMEDFVKAYNKYADKFGFETAELETVIRYM